MPAITMRAVLRRIVRFGGDRNTRLYYAACVSLLVVAAGLRFHDLSEHYLRFDEAVTANNSRGTFSETISNTRCCNSNPILYPWSCTRYRKSRACASVVVPPDFSDRELVVITLRPGGA